MRFLCICSEMRMGRWSDVVSGSVFQVVVRARVGEHAVRSGEVGLWAVL